MRNLNPIKKENNLLSHLLVGALGALVTGVIFFAISEDVDNSIRLELSKKLEVEPEDIVFLGSSKDKCPNGSTLYDDKLGICIK